MSPESRCQGDRYRSRGWTAGLGGGRTLGERRWGIRAAARSPSKDRRSCVAAPARPRPGARAVLGEHGLRAHSRPCGRPAQALSGLQEGRAGKQQDELWGDRQGGHAVGCLLGGPGPSAASTEEAAALEAGTCPASSERPHVLTSGAKASWASASSCGTGLTSSPGGLLESQGSDTQRRVPRDRRRAAAPPELALPPPAPRLPATHPAPSPPQALLPPSDPGTHTDARTDTHTEKPRALRVMLITKPDLHLLGDSGPIHP